MSKARDQLTWLNGIRAATAFAIYKLIEDLLGDGTALDGIGAEVVVWVVGLVGAFIVVITLPPVYRALPFQVVPMKRARNQALGARCIQLASEMIEFWRIAKDVSPTILQPMCRRPRLRKRSIAIGCGQER